MSTTPTAPQEPIGNFDQPVLQIGDPQTYGSVRTAIESSFSSGNAPAFLKSIERAGLRVRQFEEVLAKGLLGGSVKAEYATLGNADQGQIREFYLASLERIPMDLRDKFFKLYAYY